MTYSQAMSNLEKISHNDQTALAEMKQFINEEIADHDEQYARNVSKYGKIAIEAQDFHDACGDR